MIRNSTSSQELLSTTALYGYIPSQWVCYMFVTLFSITTANCNLLGAVVVHLGEMLIFKPRLYWLLPTVVMCGIGEILGWSGRLWSSKDPINLKAYLMQITTTILAPVFLTAALYTILGLVINIIGFEYSRLKPKTYLKVFIAADIVALLVQAAGGAIASEANTASTGNLGAHIMLFGIVLQMVAMLCYTLLAIEFLLRVFFQKPITPVIRQSPSGSSLNDKSRKSRTFSDVSVSSPRIGLMVLGLALATMLVFIRTIYRTIELLGGWRGHIIRTQIFFNVLDATPICLALFVLNFLSPTFLLRAES